MRKLLLLITFLGCCIFLNAQDLRNSNNALIGKIESDGTVRNSNNAKIGKGTGNTHLYTL